MEYRIKQHHNLELPTYLPNAFITRANAEICMRELDISDPAVKYSVVYGQYYTATGGFAEIKEPK